MLFMPCDFLGKDVIYRKRDENGHWVKSACRTHSPLTFGNVRSHANRFERQAIVREGIILKSVEFFRSIRSFTPGKRAPCKSASGNFNRLRYIMPFAVSNREKPFLLECRLPPRSTDPSKINGNDGTDFPCFVSIRLGRFSARFCSTCFVHAVCSCCCPLGE